MPNHTGRHRRKTSQSVGLLLQPGPWLIQRQPRRHIVPQHRAHAFPMRRLTRRAPSTSIAITTHTASRTTCQSMTHRRGSQDQRGTHGSGGSGQEAVLRDAVLASPRRTPKPSPSQPLRRMENPGAPGRPQVARMLTVLSRQRCPQSPWPISQLVIRPSASLICLVRMVQECGGAHSGHQALRASHKYLRRW